LVGGDAQEKALNFDVDIVDGEATASATHTLIHYNSHVISQETFVAIS
jgi:hypothetical protein